MASNINNTIYLFFFANDRDDWLVVLKRSIFFSVWIENSHKICTLFLIPLFLGYKVLITLVCVRVVERFTRVTMKDGSNLNVV